MLSIAKRASKAQKKNLGREKSVQCEKGPVWGQKGPHPRQKGPGRCASVGPCDPLAHKTGRQKPTKGGDQPSGLEGLPLALTRARGW